MIDFLQENVPNSCSVLPWHGPETMLLRTCRYRSRRRLRLHLCQQYMASERNGQRNARVAVHTVLPSG